MLSVGSCSSCPVEFSDGRGPNLDLQDFTALLLGQSYPGSEREPCKPLHSSALRWHFLERIPVNVLCKSWVLSVNTNRDTEGVTDFQEQGMGKDRAWLQDVAVLCFPSRGHKIPG